MNQIAIITADTETTGPNYLVDEPWSWTHIIDIIDIDTRKHVTNSPITTRYLQHTRQPNQWVLDHTDYLQYFPSIAYDPASFFTELGETLYNLLPKGLGHDLRVRRTYLAGKNVMFDDAMIKRFGMKAGMKFGLSPGTKSNDLWHYRLMDIGNITLGACLGMVHVSRRNRGLWKVPQDILDIHRAVRPPSTEEAYRMLFDSEIGDEHARLHTGDIDVRRARAMLFKMLQINVPEVGE